MWHVLLLDVTYKYFVLVKGIDDDDNYRTGALFACLFAWIVIDLTIVMPLSLAAKFTSVTNRVYRLRTSTAVYLSDSVNRIRKPSTAGVELEGATDTLNDDININIAKSRLVSTETANPLHD